MQVVPLSGKSWTWRLATPSEGELVDVDVCVVLLTSETLRSPCSLFL